MKIALLGDIALYGKYSMSNPHIFDYFKDVSEFLKSFDYVIGNFETPFVDEKCKPRLGKSAHISSSPENVELLKYLHITHVNLANNHMYDYGRRGLDITLELLSENNIEYFGVDGIQTFIEKDGTRLALSGFCCYSTNALSYQKKCDGKGVHVLDPSNIERVIQNNCQNGYFNIVSMHMGEEHVHYPNYDHITMARKISDNGVPYFLYGHHPHVIQGMEKYKENYHAYSLGNFCFDDVYTKKSDSPLVKQSMENKDGLIISLDIQQKILKNVEAISISNKDCSMVLFDGTVSAKLGEYCELLKINEVQFRTIRREKFDVYYASRKQSRNIAWYMKRLNLNSVIQLNNWKRNSILYSKTVKKYNSL